MNHFSTEHNGTSYDCTCQGFADVIEIMIYKNNRICKVFGCQLVPNPGGVISSEVTLPNIDPRPLVGSNSEDATGLLYAEIVASKVSRDLVDETRELIIGFGDIGPRGEVQDKDRDELEVVRQLVAKATVGLQAS